MAGALELTPERARIFRITHINNVPWILKNGLHCGKSATCDPDFVQIGNPDLIVKRPSRSVPVAPWGTLADYIPFYFTPFSPMLLNIKTGYQGIQQRPMKDIVILVSSLHTLSAAGVKFVFTDRHAFLFNATFSSDTAELATRIDWKILQARDFSKRNTTDLDKFDRYMAEALAHHHVPVAALGGVVCHGTNEEAHVRELVQNEGVQLEVVARPTWFF